MIAAHLSHTTITSASQDAFSSYEKSRFGERKSSHIEYSMLEALFLLKNNKLTIISNKKSLSFEELLTKAKKIDKRIALKFPVFENLRKRGYIVKTALKFGAEFRVYPKGVKPGQDHASWLLHPVKEHETITWYDFAAKMRVGTSTNKKLMIAVVDAEDDVTYYEVSWLKP
jgi:tRNA-intron endonuclease